MCMLHSLKTYHRSEILNFRDSPTLTHQYLATATPPGTNRENPKARKPESPNARMPECPKARKPESSGDPIGCMSLPAVPCPARIVREWSQEYTVIERGVWGVLIPKGMFFVRLGTFLSL